MASPQPIDPSASTSAKRRPSTTIQAGTSPNIPNIPPRASTPLSNGTQSFAASYKPQSTSFSRTRSPSNSLTPKPSIDALVVDKRNPKAQQASSALTAQLGSSPSATPPIEHTVSRKGSTSLRPDNNRTISGQSTPRKNESSFSNLVDVPDEEKAKVLGRHLLSAAERTTKVGTPGGASPGSGSPTKETSPSGSGIIGGESGVSGVSGYGSVDDPSREGESFPIPYDAPGMDVTHDLYKWQQDHANPRPTRSASFSHIPLDRSALLDPTLAHIKEPGGFRRNFVAAKAQETGQEAPAMARNLVDFLFLYGHFAGEDLDEDEDVDTEDEADEAEEGRSGPSRPVARRDPSAVGERQPLIGNRSYSKSRIRRAKGPGQGTATVTQATLMLLKGFVGTGILFMGKAFLNGGILFSTIVLLSIAAISLFSFLLLTQTYLVVPGSFGDIGGQLYGQKMRFAILISITVSQIGFVAAYTIFIAENLQAFILAVSDCRTYISIKYLILAQLAVFLPLAMIRNLAKLSGTALIADAFILIGLVYIGVNETSVLKANGIADVVLFNKESFPLLIGTAVFAFEGIGLVIPITESMKEPKKFPKVLSGVMFLVAVLFAGFGVLGYAAYGSNIQTVVIVNLPQEDKFVQAVQFLYSVAILLSIPLQLFPAVRIMENGLLPRSGKHNAMVKWQKNLFRAGTVVCCSLISWAGSAELDKFVSLIGAFACIPLCFIYPPMLHLKACAKTRTAKAIDYALLAFGIVVGLYTTVQTLRSLFVPTGGKTQFGKCEVPVGF